MRRPLLLRDSEWVSALVVVLAVEGAVLELLELLEQLVVGVVSLVGHTMSVLRTRARSNNVASRTASFHSYRHKWTNGVRGGVMTL